MSKNIQKYRMPYLDMSYIDMNVKKIIKLQFSENGTLFLSRILFINKLHLIRISFGFRWYNKHHSAISTSFLV